MMQWLQFVCERAPDLASCCIHCACRFKELDFDGNKDIEYPEFVYGFSAWVGLAEVLVACVCMMLTPLPTRLGFTSACGSVATCCPAVHALVV